MSWSPARVAAETKALDDPTAYLHDVFAHKDTGAILTHLATNPDTRKKLLRYFETYFDYAIDQMASTSDPRMIALSWIAYYSKEMRPLILDKVALSLKSEPVGLSVLARIDEVISPEFIPLVARWTDITQDRYWVAAAGVVLLKQVPSFLTELSGFINKSIEGNDALIGYSAAAMAASLGFRDAVVSTSSLQSPPSLDFGDDVLIACCLMLSSLCAEDKYRPWVREKYSTLLTELLRRESQNEAGLVARSTRVKLLAGIPPVDPVKAASEYDSVSRQIESFVELLEVGTPVQYKGMAVHNAALEGLAATSLLYSSRLRFSATLIGKLSQWARELEDPGSVYGALVSLANLTEYPMKETKEQQKILDLRKKTHPTLFDTQNKPSVEEVLKRTETILQTKLLTWLSQFVSKLSVAAREQVCIIHRNMACHQSIAIRHEMARQGAIVTATYLWMCDKPRLSGNMRSIAAASIAKIMISVEFAEAVTSKFPPAASVPVLESQIFNEDSDRKNMDTYEALLALTNLSSADNDELRSLIVHKCWTKIQQALASEFLPIQRGGLEVLCNLMSCTRGALHMTHDASESSKMLSLLGNAMVSSDRASRIAATGALAMLVDWQGAPERIGHNKDVLDGIVGCLDYTTDNDVMLRVLTLICTLLNRSVVEQDDEVPMFLIYHGGIRKLEDVVEILDAEKQPEVSLLLLKAIKLLAKAKAGMN